jgi:hypothetical protein
MKKIGDKALFAGITRLIESRDKGAQIVRRRFFS